MRKAGQRSKNAQLQIRKGKHSEQTSHLCRDCHDRPYHRYEQLQSASSPSSSRTLSCKPETRFVKASVGKVRQLWADPIVSTVASCKCVHGYYCYHHHYDYKYYCEYYSCYCYYCYCLVSHLPSNYPVKDLISGGNYPLRQQLLRGGKERYRYTFRVLG